MRVAILAHERFPDRAKTALGVLRYGDHRVEAIIDRDLAGSRVHEHVPSVPDAPIVDGMDAVGAVDALLIGIAPIGGGFEERWRPDVRNALARGIDVIAGLHTFLADDPEFAELAANNGAELIDVRRPPDDLTVSEGIADTVDAQVLLTVGTDASVGKMTTTWELVDALDKRGIDAAPIPTGQTGIMVDGWGYPIDRVISDFVAGAVEELVLERGDDHDVLIVEGQGSIVHPAYSGVTCGILHGAMPDGLVLCHDATREHIHGYDDFPIPSVEEVCDLYERLAAPVSDSSIIGTAVNTSGIPSDAAARGALDEISAQLETPATDVLRFGPEPLVEVIR